MNDMTDRLWEDQVEREIEKALDAMFPHGAGRTTHTRVEHHLNQVAKRAFQAGKTHALLGLMTTEDVAAHFGFTVRRARALIQGRHEQFGVGMKVGASWLIHRDELAHLEPDEKHRRHD